MTITKTIKIPVFTIILFLLIFSCNKKAENINTNNEYSSAQLNTIKEEKADGISQNDNKEIILPEKQYFIRSYGDFEDSTKMEILKLDTNPYTAIEMIGWSDNGLFAYRTKQLHDSGMWGGWIYSIIIIDTVTDEIIERNSFIINEDIDTARNLGVLSLPEDTNDEVYNEYITKLNSLLRLYNINGHINKFTITDFKDDFFLFPINNFNCWFDYLSNEQSEDIEFDIVDWKLIIGNDAIKKGITENKEKQSKIMSNISGRKILGYYKSPYENRIAVAVIYYHYTPFSGGYHTVELDLFGCNMNIGLTQ